MNDAHRPGFLSVSQYLALPRDRDVWLINPLLPVSGALLIYAPSKTGKSSLAIQLARSLSGEVPDWMGFPVGKIGRVLYLQLDTPRTTWAARFETLKHYGYDFNDNLVMLADRDSFVKYPLDVLRPDHIVYMRDLIQPLRANVIIIDTLRKVHTGDENSSTIMSNVMTSLVGIAHPAALVLISHDRKPQPDSDKDIMTDHRGSTSIVAEMDGVVRLTKTRLYYAGRSIEEGSIKMIRKDLDNILIWEPAPDEMDPMLIEILQDLTLRSMRAKARKLSVIQHISEEAAMSRVRRGLLRLPTYLAQQEAMKAGKLVLPHRFLSTTELEDEQGGLHVPEEIQCDP